MGRKTLSGIMMILLLAGMFVIIVNVQPVKGNPGIKVVFRLLAVDGYTYTGTGAYDSAQQLIENLTAVGLNWQNASCNGYDYVSYIHLLTNSTVKASLQKYRVGSTTPANINSQMTGFLATTDTGAGESNNLTIRILYYNGHSGYNSTDVWFCWKKWINDDNYDWPVLITDRQLASNLNSGDLAKSNCTLVILDTCYAAGYFSRLGKPGRVILAASQSADHESYAWMGSSPPPGHWAAFTGNQRTMFNSTYSGPVGIIGAIKGGWCDTNGDGWYSAGEVFTKTYATVYDYENTNSSIRTYYDYNPKDQKWEVYAHEIQLPQVYQGVVWGGIPFVMYTQSVMRIWGFPPQRGSFPVTFPYNSPPCYLIATLPWQGFHNTPNHLGWTSALGPSTSLLWSTSFFDSFFDSIAVADECAFVGTLGGGGGGGMMYALSLANGAVLWSFKADGRILSSPAVANGTVFFGTGNRTIYALYEATGRLSWEYILPTGENITSSPCVVNNRVFIGARAGAYGRLYALNASSGLQFYNFTADSAIYSSPAVADGKVFFGTNGTKTAPGHMGYMYALNEFTGTPVWGPTPVWSPMRSSPTVADGRVYVGTCRPEPIGPAPGVVLALNESTGSQLLGWVFTPPVSGDFLSCPAVDSSRHLVIVSNTGGGVYALVESSGSLEWTNPMGSITMSSPAIAANGLVYIGSDYPGILFCLNETNGSVKWQYTTGSAIVASPTITDGHVLVGSMGGGVYCWGPAFPEHNVMTSKATVSPSMVGPGGTVMINYTVANVGNVDETFSVDLAYNTTLTWYPHLPPPTIFHTETVTLHPGGSIDKNYSITFAPGNYTIIVLAEPVPGEISVTNNDRIAGNVQVSPAGAVYVKPSFPDYAPSGMPDFDEKQDAWGPGVGIYTWCCPVAAANSLWWLDSEYESVKFAYPVPPPTISDHFSLVNASGAWDDHSPSNVAGLVVNLAFLMDTDGQRTHNVHTGTRWVDVAPGIQQYLVQQGVGGTFQVHSSSFPGFAWIDSQTEACQDVELFVEFWQQTGGGWTNSTISNPSLELGHCVTSAGVNTAASQLLISDPYFDVASPFPPAVHNDAQFVSHDAYTVSQWMLGPGPYGPLQPIWELAGYCQQNMGLPPTYHAFIRGAVATSPLVSPVHDVAVTNLRSSKTVICRGLGDNITVTAQNQGNFTENFNVQTYANQTVIGTLSFSLLSGSSASKSFTWDTTSFAFGTYNITASATPVLGETNTANNNRTDGTVTVLPAAPVAGIVGITGYKLVFKETMNNSLGSPVTIDYFWSFSMDKWSGVQWVAAGISGSSTPVTGYIISGLATVDLPCYVYLLPSSGPGNVTWGDWLRINYTFHWTYSSTNYSTDYVAKQHVHPADIAGAASVTFPLLGADGKVGTADLHVLGVQWGSSSAGADPTSDRGRADINGDGKVGTADLHILGVEWGQTWTNTPPP